MMTSNVIDPGNQRKLTARFEDADFGVPIDPESVHLVVRFGDGTEVEYTYGDGDVIVRDSLGYYHAIITFEVSGKSYYRWWSTGAGKASLEEEIVVRSRATI